MHFVIAGKIDCHQYSYAVMVAQRLSEHLPDFTYLKIPKKPHEWENWLVCTCKENHWYHVKSPLIWREIGLKKGKKEFIGDINRFLDICYDYYGIPRGVLAADEFKQKEMNWFKNRTESEFFESVKEEARNRRECRARQVCITGASSHITEIIVMELLQIHQQSREGGLEIRLFDESRKEAKLLSSANDAKHCPGPSGFGNCRVATSLKEALLNVDLVIVLDAFSRKPKESVVKWLKRNRNAMCALGKALNMYAAVHCRVIIGSPSNQPICYNANVIASFATKLHVRNIVVVTQDLGREMLKPLSMKTKVPLKELYCPPVWGFVGLNKYVDIAKTLQTHLYKVPGKRRKSTLPQGTEEYEIRTVECLLNDDDIRDIHLQAANHKMEAFPQLGRWPSLAKAVAIIDLLKIWGLKQEDGNGEILCLGVYSDGTFNIPIGLYWSQPVILKNGFWVPFDQYPIPRNNHFDGFYLFILGLATLYRTKIKPRRYVPPQPEIPSKINKFDFDKILESVPMEVIRTERDCLEFIKILANDELGINFDTLGYDFEEESDQEVIAPPEVVKRENLYCECWREELRKLQKVVFYRDSTTEVEVDLSDNLSGSEWTVINSPDVETVPSIPETTIPPPTPVEIVEKFEKSSSGSTVCSCGALSNGSACRCLGDRQSKPPSTEHFYKDQNAEVYPDVDPDAIYADSYGGDKHVQFHPDADTEDKISQLPRKFYGKKDAIRDEEADAKMKKRILKYEKGSMGSLEEKGEYDDEESEGSLKKASDESMKEPKFHISIEGVPYEIIGDQEGFDSLEMRRNEVESPSFKSFRDMYVDEVTSPLHVVPPPAGSSETPSISNICIPGEGDLVFEKCPEPFIDSSDSLEKALDAIYSQELLMGEGESGYSGELECTREDLDSYEEQGYKVEENPEASVAVEKPKKPKIPKWERLGIPLCCFCRCILPEGLPCCPCGSKTVVEVFKKESIEVFVQSEEDISYRIQVTERLLPLEEEPDIEESYKKKREKMERDLPPESFFPFSPKVPNEFMPAKRPTELTKEYIDSLRPPPTREIPPECVELMNSAKIKLEAEEARKKAEEEAKPKKIEEEEEERENKCLTDELPVKTDFSNLNLFTPEGIEDWRVRVQTKYREWFYQGPKLQDESYYDIAIGEVSEDEFDVDKELENYFEL